MSIQAVGWALEQQIPAGPKLVLVALANHADHTTGLCWPSVATIAHEASCSPRAVYRFVADLTRNGYVMAQKKRGKDGRQRSNNYWLLFDRAETEWSAVPPSHAQDAEAETVAEQDVAPDAVHEDEPGDHMSPGEDGAAEPPENAMTPGVKDEPGDTESPGPSDSGVTRQESSLEPSGLEPSQRASLRPASLPARYDGSARPSALASAAADEARRKNTQVFVIEHTRAMDAWEKHRGRSAPRTTHTVNGKLCRGWWFPTLFPPSGHDPPNSAPSDEDSKKLVNLR